MVTIILVRALTYVKHLEQLVSKASENAVLNANYMMKAERYIQGCF